MRSSLFPQKWTLREGVMYALSLVLSVGVYALLGGFDAHPGLTFADNTLLTISMITREALRVLENNLTFALRVNRQFDDKFGVDGAKIGNILNVRKPPQYIVAEGPGLVIQDATEQQTQVTLDKQYQVGLQFTSTDLLLSIDDFSQRFLQPACSAIANKIDQAGLALAQQINQSVGTPGTTPADLITYLNAGVKLDDSACPMDGQRSVILTPRMQATLVDALKGLFQQSSAIASQYTKGQMGTAAGFEFYMDQNAYVHTVGAWVGAGQVNDTPVSGATSVITDTWTGSVTGLLKKGDIITFASVYAVNPQSRQSTGALKQFVVTADVDSTAGAATIPFSPAMIGPGSPFQNVDALAADNAVITVLGAASTVTPQGLAFHKDAFTFVSADLPLPKGVDMAARMSDKQLGISIRLIRDYDINTDAYPCRLDVLCGWAVLRQELACRIAA